MNRLYLSKAENLSVKKKTQHSYSKMKMNRKVLMIIYSN